MTSKPAAAATPPSSALRSTRSATKPVGRPLQEVSTPRRRALPKVSSQPTPRTATGADKPCQTLGIRKRDAKAVRKQQALRQLPCSAAGSVPKTPQRERATRLERGNGGAKKAVTRVTRYEPRTSDRQVATSKKQKLLPTKRPRVETTPLHPQIESERADGDGVVLKPFTERCLGEWRARLGSDYANFVLLGGGDERVQ